MSSIVTSIIGGVQGASAAHNAAKAQHDAALQAGKTVTDATNAANPQIGAAAKTAGDLATGTAATGSANVANTAATGAGNVNTAANLAASGVKGAITDANSNLQPYIGAGQQGVTSLGQMLGAGGSLTKTFGAADMEANDPGYQFRIDEASKAMQRAQAAGGSVQGGGSAKALGSYTQNVASAEYQNAFSRFQSGQQQQYAQQLGLANLGVTPALAAGSNIMQGNEYAGNVGLQGAEYGSNLNQGAAQYGASLNQGAAQYSGTAGMSAADLMAQNSIGAGRYLGDAQMGAGNALAAGDLNAANAWSGMLNGIGKGVDSLAMGAATGGFGGGDFGGYGGGSAGAGGTYNAFSGPGAVGTKTKGF